MSISSSNSDDIRLHKLTEKSLRMGMIATDEVGIKNRHTVRPDFARTPNQHEFYLIRVARSISQLINLIDQLELAPELITIAPTKHMRRAGISKHRLLVYESENYLIRATGIYDRMLRLVDIVFNIGNSGTFISHTSLISNTHVASSKIPTRLKALKKILGKVSGQRHEIAHEATYEHDELRRLEMYYILSRSAQLEGKRHPASGMIPGLSQKIVRRSKLEFSQLNKKILNATLNIFNELEKVFDPKVSDLKKLIGIEHWSEDGQAMYNN